MEKQISEYLSQSLQANLQSIVGLSKSIEMRSYDEIVQIDIISQLLN